MSVTDITYTTIIGTPIPKGSTSCHSFWAADTRNNCHRDPFDDTNSFTCFLQARRCFEETGTHLKSDWYLSGLRGSYVTHDLMKICLLMKVFFVHQILRRMQKEV